MEMSAFYSMNMLSWSAVMLSVTPLEIWVLFGIFGSGLIPIGCSYRIPGTVLVFFFFICLVLYQSSFGHPLANLDSYFICFSCLCDETIMHFIQLYRSTTSLSTPGALASAATAHPRPRMRRGARANQPRVLVIRLHY